MGQVIEHDEHPSDNKFPAQEPGTGMGQVHPMQIIQAAIERGTDVAQLERLMDLQERFEANEARKAFVQALARFKMMGLTVSKTGNVKYETDKGRVDFRHATLDNVCNTLGPALSACGLSWRWETKRESSGDKSADKIIVSCILSHELGHSETTELYAFPDISGGKNTIQAIGSTVTYLQRYTLMAATGTAATDQDDDGAGAGDDAREEKQKSSGRSELPVCSPEYFEKVCTDIPDPKKPGEIKRFGIKSLIEMGQNTVDDTIDFLSSKVILTEEQEKEIRSWRKK